MILSFQSCSPRQVAAVPSMNPDLHCPASHNPAPAVLQRLQCAAQAEKTYSYLQYDSIRNIVHFLQCIRRLFSKNIVIVE